MAKLSSTRPYRSRLAKQESKRLKRQTFLIITITILLLAALVVIGIPLLIKMSVFMSQIGDNSDTVTKQDAIPPQTPVLSSPPEATNSATLNITGASEPGATITLFHNNQERIKTVVDAAGQFEFLKLDLKPGQNVFYAVAKDAQGNESQRSPTRTVLFDTKPPEITLTAPSDGDYIVGVTRQNVKIEGNAEAGARVELNGQLLLVRSDGSFTGTYNLKEGDNTLQFTVTDQAGNTSETSLTLTYSPE